MLWYNLQGLSQRTASTEHQYSIQVYKGNLEQNLVVK